MNIAVISLTENGRKISEKIQIGLKRHHTCVRYTYEKYTDEKSVIFKDLKDLTSDIFHEYDGIIYISACGIAVRMIAKHIVSKASDPAVIAIDEQGRFTVPLLSGHIGGANELAKKISEIINSTAVITTATDIGQKFSPDSFAKANGLYICEMDMAKKFAAAVVNGEKIGFYCEYPVKNYPDIFFNKNIKNMGICISPDTSKSPFTQTLRLVPKNIIIGIGCKKNTDPIIFSQFVFNMLKINNIPLWRVSEIHTIDIKKHEKAIIQFSKDNNIPLKFYSSNQLMSISGEFSHSDFVMKTTGADNICERSAAVNGGVIIVPKQAENGMTFAASEENIFIDFERTIL